MKKLTKMSIGAFFASIIKCEKVFADALINHDIHFDSTLTNKPSAWITVSRNILAFLIILTTSIIIIYAIAVITKAIKAEINQKEKGLNLKKQKKVFIYLGIGLVVLVLLHTLLRYIAGGFCLGDCVTP